jgi:hypothetical protein
MTWIFSVKNVFLNKKGVDRKNKRGRKKRIQKAGKKGNKNREWKNLNTESRKETTIEGKINNGKNMECRKQKRKAGHILIY